MLVLIIFVVLVFLKTKYFDFLNLMIIYLFSAIGEGGHVRIVKVQPALTKVLLEIGCLYLAIIMSSYSRFIVPVKKIQFPP